MQTFSKEKLYKRRLFEESETLVLNALNNSIGYDHYNKIMNNNECNELFSYFEKYEENNDIILKFLIDSRPLTLCDYLNDNKDFSNKIIARSLSNFLSKEYNSQREEHEIVLNYDKCISYNYEFNNKSHSLLKQNLYQKTLRIFDFDPSRVIHEYTNKEFMEIIEKNKDFIENELIPTIKLIQLEESKQKKAAEKSIRATVHFILKEIYGYYGFTLKYKKLNNTHLDTSVVQLFPNVYFNYKNDTNEIKEMRSKLVSKKDSDTEEINVNVPVVLTRNERVKIITKDTCEKNDMDIAGAKKLMTLTHYSRDKHHENVFTYGFESMSILDRKYYNLMNNYISFHGAFEMCLCVEELVNIIMEKEININKKELYHYLIKKNRTKERAGKIYLEEVRLK
jgi:hypothetical protein